MENEIKFFDANGVEWHFDGKRVYCPAGEDMKDNGYPADTLEEALILLDDYGFMWKK